MLHPSYAELIEAVNEQGPLEDGSVIESRYSIVIASAKRARQIVDGQEPYLSTPSDKPLSIAVEELYEGKVKITSQQNLPEDEIEDV